MKHIKAFLLCLLTITLCNAQDSKKEKITKALTDYFFLERENIHVQFDKKIFTTDEEIWFKGYVFHRKKNLPFFTTINVYAALLDSDGKILEKQLVYNNIGSFSGSFALNENYPSGKYYLQFYTNWMNNFTEDESAVYQVTIVNRELGAGMALAQADPEKLNIDLCPEGTTYLSGVANTMAISLSDCNHNPVTVPTVDIIDDKGNPYIKVQINSMGYGRFNLPPTNAGGGYKAVVNYRDKKYEKALPPLKTNGVALNVATVSGKTILTLKTNTATLPSLNQKPLYVVVHRDDAAAIFDAKFDGETEQKLAFDNAILAEGLYTVRVLDENLNQLAERLIYKYPETSLNTTLGLGRKQDSPDFTINGKTNYPNMNLSVSVVPLHTKSVDEANDIYGSLWLLPYIENQIKANGKHYFETPSRGKSYELDMFLMCQKSKYKWNDILNNAPKSNHPFDMGLTLKGTVPSSAGKADPARVRLYMLGGIDEVADVKSDNREFEYQNLILSDSSHVNFTLQRRDKDPKQLQLQPVITNGNRSYNKMYKPQPVCYTQQHTTITDTDIPEVFDEDIMLNEVKIERSALKYASSYGNGKLHGYKISEMKASAYQNILNFITTYGGFRVNNDVASGTVSIVSRTNNTVKGGQTSPIIYIDNVQLMDYSMLQLIQMSEVDEIYMSAHTIVPSLRNYMGMIKIYLNKGAKGIRKDNTPDIVVRGGFERIKPFKNVSYNSTIDQGFENFGLIDWEPVIMTDEEGNFSFDIPNTGQKDIKLIIEGFSADGKLISEIKTLHTN